MGVGVGDLGQLEGTERKWELEVRYGCADQTHSWADSEQGLQSDAEPLPPTPPALRAPGSSAHSSPRRARALYVLQPPEQRDGGGAGLGDRRL